MVHRTYARTPHSLARRTNRRLLRSAGEDMIPPLSKPLVGSDGTEMTEIGVPEGTTIAVSILRAN